ncbi:MAG: hypothetical protein HQL22_09580 [Candidatus Omnitrophica bacterium]|nr:hypothetical protein [Candidatus Omnitrophota bacterium]
MMNQSIGKQGIELITDRDWDKVSDRLCRVSGLLLEEGVVVENHLVVETNQNSKALPYCKILVECAEILDYKKVPGAVTHKIDFVNLWDAFNKKDVLKGKEEVLVFWSKKHYTNPLACILVPIGLSVFLPRLLVLLCPSGTYDSVRDGFQWPSKDKAMVLYYALGATDILIPDVMK